MTKQDEVPELWRHYRRVKRRFILLALGWMPFCVLLLEISTLNRRLEPITLLLFAYMAWFMVALLQFETYRCPKCGVSFFLRWPPFPRKCAGCGIPINKEVPHIRDEMKRAQPITDTQAPASFAGWLGSGWRARAVAFVGLFALVWLIVALVETWASSQMRSSDATKLTIAAAEASPALTEELGRPLKMGTLISGYVSASTGTAQVEVPVSGPHGNGVLYAKVLRQSGAWQVQSLEFRGDGTAANLVLLPVQNQSPKAPSQ
jgi:hypothetical protein